MLTRRGSYAETYAGFEWAIPEFYNIGRDVCDKWAERDPERLAILQVTPEGVQQVFSFKDLQHASNRLANLLSGQGLADAFVGVLLPQCFETAVAHVAVSKMGGVSIPLFTQFGTDALFHRLSDSGAKVVITNAEGAGKIAAVRHHVPTLEQIYSIDGPTALGVQDFHTAIASESVDFSCKNTRAEEPTLLIYTSGTTGAPKGALHAHRVLLGHLPGVEMSHNFFPQPGDRIWTPADWAWIGGLLDVLLPALHHGVPIVAHRFAKFTGAGAVALMQQAGVRNAFLPPTALKMMKAEHGEVQVPMRSVASGGETLGAELLSWGDRTFGTTINEFYGQTECNMIVSSCVDLDPAEPGVMGYPVPGHRVAIVDNDGVPLPQGMEGDIAVQSPNPVMFLEYLNRPDATKAKFRGDWMLTGDRGVEMLSGRIKFVGRDDDVISSAGYRIGPAEIEDCLLQHPAVAIAGVVGRPDAERGSVVVAFVVLADGYVSDAVLVDALKAHVRARLAPYETPRDIVFVDEMPLTTTGKIIRRVLRDWVT